MQQSSLYLLLAVTATCFCHVVTEHCYPGMSCWPQYQEWVDYASSLDGKAIFGWDPEYHTEIIMYNTRVSRFPYAIAMAETQADVIKSVEFANKHKIRITVRSSGHDYIGRATADGSLQINLKNMKKLTFNMSDSRNAAGTVTAQSGNTWLRVYNETHKHNRTIVGGSAKTVSMGGYTLGGGHSPISRKFGMAVDNLLAVSMVAANGSVVWTNATHVYVDNHDGGPVTGTKNGDLFWALRGGGGSTYGIVIEFTFKLHYDSKMVTLACSIPYNNMQNEKQGAAMSKAINSLLVTSLAPEWGGYEFWSGEFDPKTSTTGAVSLYLNHFGEWGSASFYTMKPFWDKYQDHCMMQNYSSFLDYETTTNDPLYYRSYIMNILMQRDSFTDAFYDYLYNFTTVSHGISGGTGCTGVFIGGQVQQTAVDDTAVNPYFRSAVMSLTCGMSWSEVEESQHVAVAEQLTDELLRFGHGTYFNEPSAYLPDWKTAYWGSHYNQLYRVKQRWDPHNVLSCYHCVGSDEHDGLTGNPSTIVGK